MNDEFKTLIAEQRKRIRPYVLAFTSPWLTEDDVIADYLPAYKKGEQLLWRMIALATTVFDYEGVKTVVHGDGRRYEDTASAIAQQFYQAEEHPVQVLLEPKLSHTPDYWDNFTLSFRRLPRKERGEWLLEHRQMFTDLIKQHGADTVFIASSAVIESCLYDKITMRRMAAKDKLLHTAPGDAVLFIADGRPLARTKLSW